MVGQRCRGCRNIIVHVIWDGGAEGTSISDTCLSSILREQGRQGLPAEKCAFNYMSRMSPHQSFVGFANHSNPDGSIKVEIQGQLHLETPGGDAFPPLDVRMVPGQNDDILVAAPDLDKWGWDRESDPKRFVFKRLGISVPRSTTAPEAEEDDHAYLENI